MEGDVAAWSVGCKLGAPHKHRNDTRLAARNDWRGGVAGPPSPPPPQRYTHKRAPMMASISPRSTWPSTSCRTWTRCPSADVAFFFLLCPFPFPVPAASMCPPCCRNRVHHIVVVVSSKPLPFMHPRIQPPVLNYPPPDPPTHLQRGQQPRAPRLLGVVGARDALPAKGRRPVFIC